MKNSFFLILSIWISCFQICFSQGDCSSATCLTNSLIINTGYNHSNATLFSDGQQDPYWILTNAPTDVVVNLNGPGYAIASTWGAAISNSKYISAFSSSGSNKSNVDLSKNPYSFERCFCTCGNGVKVDYDITVRVDNQVKFYLDNVLLPGQPAQLSTTTTKNFDGTDDVNNKVQGTIVLNAGRHCLRAELRNDNASSPMGLDIKGSLTTAGNSLLKETCCNNQGFVVGYKYKDENCNGVKDAEDKILPNWKIQLTGNGQSKNCTTDANGYYTFTVPAGTYTVGEEQQTGWRATNPKNGSKSGVVITANSITQIDFLNCDKPIPITFDPCCPPINPDLMNTMFKFTPTGGMNDPYKMTFTPTAFFKSSSQAYCDYIKTLYPSINRLTYEWRLFSAGTGTQPDNSLQLDRIWNWFEPQGNGVIKSQTNFFNNSLAINTWYKIHVGIFTEPESKAFKADCSNNTFIYFQVKVANSAVGGGSRKAILSDGKNVIKEITL